MLLSALGQWGGLLALSAAIACALTLAQLPAALLLGPMLAAIAFGIGGARVRVPRLGFQGAQALIGCLVAHSVNASILRTLLDDGVLMLAVVLVTVLASALVGLVLTRARLLPGSTAAWGSSPGAAAAMVALAEEHGADPRLVAFMQYVRVVCVALAAALVGRLFTGAAPAAPSMPGPADPSADLGAVAATLAVALVGAVAGRRLRVPAGALMGPLALGSVLHATGVLDLTLPQPLLMIAYAAVGWYVGLRFTRATVKATLRALPAILIATAAIIALCGGWAYGLTRILPIDFLTAFLATSPGGLDSVAIIAVGSHADTSFVLAVQTLRLVVVLLIGPFVAKLIARAASGSA